MPDSPRDLAIMVACFNRSELTERAVRQILAIASSAQLDARVFVFDDASTDQTAARLQTIDGPVTVITGPGNYFWAASMAAVEREALGWVSDEGHLLWLNDDVNLDTHGVLAAIRSATQAPGDVLIGQTTDPVEFTKITYGAFKWVGPHPLRFELAHQGEQVDAFNGNFVLVPARVAKDLGGIDGGFTHALADIEYGVRLAKRGIMMRTLDQPVGTCSRNAPATGSTRKRWTAFVSPKGGGNPKSLVRFLKRSNRITWPLWLVATYAQWWRREFARLVVRNRAQ